MGRGEREREGGVRRKGEGGRGGEKEERRGWGGEGTAGLKEE